VADPDDARARRPEAVGVDETGVTITGGDDVVLDVSFDGRRIWSFWSHRDTTGGRRSRQAPWPEPLRAHLDGVATVRVSVHGEDHALFEQEVRFGAGEGRVAIVDRKGRPLGLDNTGKLIATFENRSGATTAPLLDAIESVLGELTAAGIAAFPAYGTLLGAVRDGRLIGHDSDADLGYVSRFSHPFDVVRESFALQRRLAEKFEILRYSGASFKVRVTESDGVARGLDVFGGYLAHGNLHLLGEIRTPFREEWILPLGTCQLEGRTLPAPAVPERLLEATYGPHWRVPDPAFRFETPQSTIRAFNAWFRATRSNRASWSRAHHGAGGNLEQLTPSALARHVLEVEGVPARLDDLGAGQGVDALWFARQGASVTAYDFIPTAANRALRRARRRGWDLEVRPLNFQEWRSVFSEGARVARRPGPRVLMANHLLDATGPFGRDAVARVASMALRDGGRFYADFWSGGGQRDGGPERPVPLEGVVRVLERQGAHILQATERAAEDTDEPAGRGRRTGRVVARWS
jgi:hypothetical protein